MNFRQWVIWVVRHLPKGEVQLWGAALLGVTYDEIHPRVKLDWTINGEFFTAEWDHPVYGQGWLTITKNEQGRFQLARDALVRARSLPLGVFDTRDIAVQTAEDMARKVEEQYA
jgi:hypothetical protein